MAKTSNYRMQKPKNKTAPIAVYFKTTRIGSITPVAPITITGTVTGKETPVSPKAYLAAYGMPQHNAFDSGASDNKYPFDRANNDEECKTQKDAFAMIRKAHEINRRRAAKQVREQTTMFQNLGLMDRPQKNKSKAKPKPKKAKAAPVAETSNVTAQSDARVMQQPDPVMRQPEPANGQRKFSMTFGGKKEEETETQQ